MPIACVGREWFGLDYLIRAFQPEPADPDAPSELVVTMLPGVVHHLRGEPAERMIQCLMDVSMPSSSCAQEDSPGEPGEIEYARRVRLTQGSGGSAVGKSQD